MTTPGSKSSTKRRKQWTTAGYFATFITLGLTTASLGPSLPYLAENTNTLISQISYLFTARSGGYLIGSWMGGRAYDRRPGHQILVVMLLSIAITLVLIPVLSNIWLLVLVLVVVGLAEGAVDVGGNTLLVWLYRKDVGPFMNALHTFFGLGSFFAPIILALALRLSAGITYGYWALALMVVPVMIWIARLPSPRANTSGDESETHIKRTLSHSEVILIVIVCLFFFLYAGAEVSFGGWIYTYSVKTMLVNKTSAAYLNSAYWGAFTLSRLLSIPLATRLRPRKMMSLDLTGCVLSIGIILFWPQSSWALWVGTIGFGISSASVFPTTLSLAERRLDITGQITGWFFVGASLGGMFLPWLIGQFFEIGGHRTTMFILEADLLILVAVLWLLISKGDRE